VDILEKIAPGARVHVWSDMFDPAHNAVERYYLVRGSWDGLPPSVVIINWISGHADESLPFFAGRGHKQVLAGYYDGDPLRIGLWLAEARKVQGVIGVMYTTWKHDYSKLEEFAKAVSATE